MNSKLLRNRVDENDMALSKLEFIVGPFSCRCLAPDLVGFGKSGKIPNFDYRFINMYKYFCAWMDQIAPQGKIIIVHHDWGSCFGFHWAYEHQDRVKVRNLTFIN